MAEIDFDKLCKKIIVKNTVKGSTVTAYIENGTDTATQIEELVIWRFNKFAEITIPYGYEKSVNVIVLHRDYHLYAKRLQVHEITGNKISIEVQQELQQKPPAMSPREQRYERDKAELQGRLRMEASNGNKSGIEHFKRELHRIEMEFQNDMHQLIGTNTSPYKKLEREHEPEERIHHH